MCANEVRLIVVAAAVVVLFFSVASSKVFIFGFQHGEGTIFVMNCEKEVLIG